MKITAFNGSPRAGRGNTHIVVDDFLKGAFEAGADVENVFLAGMEIRPCTGCFTCWTKTPGKCAMEDDMRSLLPKYSSSDLVIFASPVYVDCVTGIMKSFMDRLIPLGDPHFELDENGETRHAGGRGSPGIAVISSCGFPEQSQFQVMRHFFQRVARSFHTRVVVEIYRGEGALLGEPPVAAAEAVRDYRALVRRAGGEVVRDGRISEETRRGLELPLMPYDDYVREGNRYWDEILARMEPGKGE